MKKLSEIMAIVGEWKNKYHCNNKGDIVFQNKPTRANVVLDDNTIHIIAKHPDGFDKMAATISGGEIWSLWGDQKQLVVLRNYINGNYIVSTRNGRVVDAFQVANRSINNYRKGVLII